MAREYSYNQAGVIGINTVLFPAVEIDDLNMVSLQVASLGTNGVVTVQMSNDNATWHPLLMRNAGTFSTQATSINSTGSFYAPHPAFKYIRVLLSTATTAGTTTLYLRLGKKNISVSDNSVLLGSGTAQFGKVLHDVSATAANGPTILIHRLLCAAATTNATSVKTSAGRLLKIRGYNNKASAVFLKLYNKASAPTVGTDTPVATFLLRAQSEFDFDIEMFGLQFSTGIAYAITGAVADNDTTALAANDVFALNTFYI